MAMRRVHTSIGKEWEGMNPDNADCGLVCLFAVLDVYHPLQKRSKTVCTVYPRNIIATIQLRVAGGFTFASITQSPSGTIRQAFMRVLPSYPLALEIAIRHLQPK